MKRIGDTAQEERDQIVETLRDTAENVETQEIKWLLQILIHLIEKGDHWGEEE